MVATFPARRIGARVELTGLLPLNDSVWKPALRRAGLPTSCGMHALRHTYASSLIAAGLHPTIIQARLGHKSIVETMDTYGHLFPEQLHETSAVLDGCTEGPLRNRPPGQLRVWRRGVPLTGSSRFRTIQR